MGQLAVGIVGAAAGVGLGIATGGVGFAALAQFATIGFTVGTMLGGALFPAAAQTSTSVGPRMTDIPVTTSAYGQPIPWGTGSVRLGGNVIWAADLREEETSSTVSSGGGGGKGGGGKGGGSSQTTISYVYHGTFALGLCEGPAANVLRIWADSNLVYDTTSGADTIQKPGFSFRFYPGSETQMPDSILESHLGVGNVPAHRGLCYLVFDDILLTDYGNRLPQISAEIAFAVAWDVSGSNVTMASPSIFPAAANYWEMAYDWDYKMVYLRYDQGIGVIDLATMTEVRQVPWASITNDGLPMTGIYIGADGGLYGQIARNDYIYTSVVRVDSATLRETATCAGLYSPAFLASIVVQSQLGTSDFLLIVGIFGKANVVSLPDMVKIYEDDGYDSIFGRPGGACQGATGTAWVIYGGVSDNTLCLLRQYTVSMVVDEMGDEHPEVYVAPIAIRPNELVPSATSFADYPVGLVYDRTDDSITFTVQLTNPLATAPVNVKWINGGGLAWVIGAPPGWNASRSQAYASSRPDGVALSLIADKRAIQLIPSTGGTHIDQDNTGWSAYGAQIYDGTTSSVFTCTGPGQYTLIHVGRLQALPVSLSEIVRQNCARCGLLDDELDTTQLAVDNVVGYVVTQQTAGNTAILPLATAFVFNPAEIDGKLVFVKRGGAIAATIPEDDLVRSTSSSSESAEAWTKTRLQEVELPANITVTFLDPAMNYASNTQNAGRNKGPDPTVVSQNQTSMTLPVVMTAAQAKASAELQLFEAWIARTRFSAQLSPAYLHLTATDPVTLQFGDVSQRARLNSATVGVDFSIDATFLAERDGQYLPSPLPPAEPTVPRQSISVAPASALFLLDIPFLSDADQLDGAERAYWATAPLSDAVTGWKGAYLEVSADSTPSTFIGEGFETAASIWGYVETVLPDPVSTCRADDVGTAILLVKKGAVVLSSISDPALYVGGNAIAVIKTNGEVEVMQFRDVKPLDALRVEVSFLLRGRRGTDTMASGHSHGERWVLLSPYTTQRMSIPYAMRYQMHWWRGTSIGAIPENTRLVAWTANARSRMPYAPCHIAAARAGDDIALSWVRRTRIGGDWLDGTGEVLLSEDREDYSVDILDAPGGAVKRTLRVQTPNATYAAADIASDFGTAPASLTIAVYQLSAMVGRGFGRQTTVEVTT